MKRPPIDIVFMAMADCLSFRGMCNRLRVSALIVRDKRIITSGVNGPNTYDCDELKCDTTKPCSHAIHAEENAIRFAVKHNVDLKGATIYITHQPCIDCARLIVESGITRVVYSETYRLEEGLHYLINNNIITEQLVYEQAENGYLYKGGQAVS